MEPDPTTGWGVRPARSNVPAEPPPAADATAWIFNAILLVLGAAAAVGWFFQ